MSNEKIFKVCPYCLRVFLNGRWRKIHSNGNVEFYQNKRKVICRECRLKMMMRKEPEGLNPIRSTRNND